MMATDHPCDEHEKRPPAEDGVVRGGWRILWLAQHEYHGEVRAYLTDGADYVQIRSEDDLISAAMEFLRSEGSDDPEGGVAELIEQWRLLYEE